MCIGNLESKLNILPQAHHIRSAIPMNLRYGRGSCTYGHLLYSCVYDVHVSFTFDFIQDCRVWFVFSCVGVVVEQWPRLQKRYEHCSKKQTVLKNNMGYMKACMMSDSYFNTRSMHAYDALHCAVHQCASAHCTCVGRVEHVRNCAMLV